MTEPRDWDKELANIDKAIARSGNAPPPVSSGAPMPPPTRPVPGARERSIDVADAAVQIEPQGGGFERKIANDQDVALGRPHPSQ